MADNTEEGKDYEAVLKRYPILKYFRTAHLPENFKVITQDIQVTAWNIAMRLPPSPETSTALRKLLEAQDCIIRGLS